MKAIILLLFLALSSCSKDNESQPQDQLPPITTTGANTAGGIINGKVLIPKNGINSLSGYPVYGLTIGAGVNFNEPIIGDDYWFIKIDNLRSIGKNYGIYIHINNMEIGIGNFIVGQSNGESFADGPNNPQIIVSEYDGTVYTGKSYYSSSNSGTITITRFDYPNGIYSGIFSCILYNKDNPSETIQVSEGRFDINIATLNQ
uniref:hypothetical protein n=1 Tax=Flavobacterium sp. TaxID=239 RepID=UPI00404A277C